MNDDCSTEGTASKLPSKIMALDEEWRSLSQDAKKGQFADLGRGDAEDFFLNLSPADQSELLLLLDTHERRIWTRLLALDDVADTIQQTAEEDRARIFDLLDARSQKEVAALLAYKQDEAGGLMSPSFARVRPDMTVDEALRYLRQQASSFETTRYVYVLGHDQLLLGVVALSKLFMAEGSAVMKDLARTNLIVATDTMTQEETAHLFTQSGLKAIPVVNEAGQIKGIITIDDIVKVVEDEATQDIQMLGGTEVLDAPYLKIGLWQMIRKRVGWLTVLFVGEMFTATAMGYYQKEIERAVVLALFIPLIISSGGNSGSQASTLVVRAIALREVRLRDWWRVFYREFLVGSVLGGVLGAIGMLRIFLWPTRASLYGEHYMLVASTVALSLLGIVLWGSLAGSMLPFVLKKLRFDPATASAPFVATLVDVSGLIIYFTVASLILSGTLL